MKKSIALIAIAGFGLSAFITPLKETSKINTRFSTLTAEKGETSFKVSTERSTMNWLGKKVTGEHSGNISLAGGEFFVKKNTVTGGNFEVDMNSITVTDIPEGKYRDNLVSHLKSDDFFGTETFPKASFQIKSISPIKGAAAGSNNYDVVGDITIKGITRSINFPAWIIIKKSEVVANVDLNIDRTEFGIKYGSGNFFKDLGDKTIENNFNLKMRIVAPAVDSSK